MHQHYDKKKHQKHLPKRLSRNAVTGRSLLTTHNVLTKLKWAPTLRYWVKKFWPRQDLNPGHPAWYPSMLLSRPRWLYTCVKLGISIHYSTEDLPILETKLLSTKLRVYLLINMYVPIMYMYNSIMTCELWHAIA